MSILIKGITMPSGLAERGIIICGDGRVYNFIGTTIEGCYAIEVPASHGRLIDADELLRHKGDAYDSEGHLLYAVGTGSIIAAPTIIEAEERWVEWTGLKNK